MIVSCDTIMAYCPSYDITPAILELIVSISEKIGAANARMLPRRDPVLRKRNRIRTIHSSLRIEGNTLTEEQITAVIAKKRVAGPAKDIREVINALEVYQDIGEFRPYSIRDFLRAHGILMQGLIDHPGSFRTKSVGIVKGSKVQHLAPPASNVRHLITELFGYIKQSDELTLIKACACHYEIEFIHPFIDGNGRMGRLWQTVILMGDYPIFEFLPVESIIERNQKDYCDSLAASDKTGKSTPFIAFMLRVMDAALEEVLAGSEPRLTDRDRLLLFLEAVKGEFTRKDYMRHFPSISAPTASRDLRMAVEAGLLKRKGDKKTTRYSKKTRK